MRANASAAAPLILSLEGQGSRPKWARAHETRRLCRAIHHPQLKRERTCMAASAAYLIALALTLLILVVLWEGFS
ncbi:hypothetical protein [Bradyrhizobium erythrophlei]|jgi:hypothetical protein|uniref:Uncharacterized protein n=1 Tax=Bradyrhizobium erythrophlei TaxID=1437360 RepID=A0A1M7UFZ7_9BRAD|nr:hypothetical protein [Bradyrhizobium erythrophlei]SHN81961.1 hypothetical protein SAMN05444170_4957 [Bradyrhizobium erythrophlei]